MNKHLSFNNLQTAIAILQPKYNYLVSGRGWGKSTYFGYMLHQIVENLPGASGVIAAKTYTHVLTSILPSAFAHLERMGYVRDIHYVIGKRPPKEWGLPYHPPVKDYKNYITFYNPERPVGFYLTSQERLGSGRGPNTDFLLTDETLRLNKKRLDNELSPSLRANKDKFKKINWHLGEYHSTSMPYDQQGRWIIDKANYYLEDYGIDYLALWRQVVKMQLDLLDIEDAKEFQLQWNEINQVKKKMRPLLSKDGSTLFTLSNAFDNWQNVGISYIREQKNRLPEIVFNIEIMNMLIHFSENGFYSVDEDGHIYYDSWDDDYSNDYAIANDYDFQKLELKDSSFLNRKYYNPDKPVFLFFDWGGTISFCIACQFDQENLTVIKEFYVMPPGNMPKRLMTDVASFFKSHKNKHFTFIRDTYGDDKSRSIQKSKTINEEAIETLKKAGWKVSTKKHKYKEPPYYEKWQLMQKIFNPKDDDKFNIRIDGNNCKYLVIALKNTKVRQVGNEFSKDKRLERKQDADQRYAPHSTDALDKGCYYLDKAKKNNTFIETIISH